MIDRNALRLRKQQERDLRIQALHKKFAELKEIDDTQAQKVLALIRLSLQPERKAERAALQAEVDALAQKRTEFLTAHGLDDRIYEPKWDCAVCEDKGYVEAGKPCYCLMQEKIEAAVAVSGLPQNMRQMTFENFRTDLYPDSADVAKKVARCRKFAERIIAGEPVGNLVLLGDVGRGKTHLSAAIANAIIDQGGSVIYRRADALMDWIRSLKYDEEDGRTRNQALAQFYQVDLLVIDDLGSESVSEFSLLQLQHLIEERNGRNRSWIINSNLKLNDVETIYGERISDRMFEKATVFRLESSQSFRLLRLNSDVAQI